MKKKILRISSAFILAATLTIPSCGLIEECGFCELISVDNDGNVTSLGESLYCNEDYWDKVDGTITYTVDGYEYWSCDDDGVE